MASKYINIEDAASRLSISVEELNRMRESGKIRAFSDRGTWKFRSDEVEELARNMEPDSGFDIPSSDILNDDDLEDQSRSEEGSQIVLEDEMGDQPTVISKQPANEPPSSDSDVRLVVDPSLESESKSSSEEDPTESDSDVRFVDTDLNEGGSGKTDEGKEGDEIETQDSDDRWSGLSDSDVRLASDDESRSDSDVTLEDEQEKTADSDSDVTLAGSEEEGTSGQGSDLTLMSDDDDSGISLEPSQDEEDDSILSDVMSDSEGGSQAGDDSGISLDLADDSGISLAGDEEDSSSLGADSGISLVPDEGSGLTLADDYYEDKSKKGDATVPMMDVMDEDEDDTSFEMPSMDDESSSETDATDVVMFDDDDSEDATMEFDSSELSDEAEFVDFDSEDDSFDELSDGELEVSDDLLDDDDDILEADDDVFDDDFESGESVPALAVPGGMRGGAMAPTAEWDMVSFSLVLFSTILMGLCTLLMFDLVRSMWGFAEPNGVNGMVLDMLKGFIE